MPLGKGRGSGPRRVWLLLPRSRLPSWAGSPLLSGGPGLPRREEKPVDAGVAEPPAGSVSVAMRPPSRSAEGRAALPVPRRTAESCGASSARSAPEQAGRRRFWLLLEGTAKSCCFELAVF